MVNFQLMIFNNFDRLSEHFQKGRSNRPEVFCRKGAFENFTKFPGKHLYQRFFLNKIADHDYIY